jgi:hypothetical protein
MFIIEFVNSTFEQEDADKEEEVTMNTNQILENRTPDDNADKKDNF